MQLHEATQLIQKAKPGTPGIQRWADLGCGSGTFTKALASLLPAGSSVYGVDTQPGFEAGQTTGGVALIPLQADFMEDKLDLFGLEGILMANSFHYVPDKLTLVHKLEAILGAQKQFLIVEYDSDTVVHKWVPYPLSFAALQALFAEAGYTTIQKIGHMHSIYSKAGIYAAVVHR